MSSSQGHGRIISHKDYSLRGADLHILVGSHLYSVHSYFFYRESLAWRQMLDEPPNNQEKGTTHDAPFILEDVKTEDFERFLWVIYNPQFSLYDAPIESWLSILSLAHRWSFCNIKDLAVRELEKLNIDPIDKIAAYHEYKINKTLLLPAYTAMCKRDKPLSFTEGSTLGMETVLRIADARERARQITVENGVRSPTYDDFDDAELEDMVREVFGVSPRPMSPGRHSRNSSGVFTTFGGGFGGTSNGFTTQKPNGDANSGTNGPDLATSNPPHASTEPPSGSTGKDKKPQSPPKDDKQTNGAGSTSAPADNKANKPTGAGKGKTS